MRVVFPAVAAAAASASAQPTHRVVHIEARSEQRIHHTRIFPAHGYLMTMDQGSVTLQDRQLLPVPVHLLRTLSASLDGTGWLLGSSFLPVQIRVCFIDAFMNHPQTIGQEVLIDVCIHRLLNTHWPGFVHSAKVS